MEAFTRKRFTFPDFAGKRVLILGLGGGCDIITAYALAKLLEGRGVGAAIYGNTKYSIERDMESISEHIYRTPAKQVPLEPGQTTYGSTVIDRSLPRGAEGCPFVFIIPDGHAESRLPREIEGLGFDEIWAADTGGDSIVSTATSGPLGRDQRMLAVLKRIRVPLLHVVVAPGSDGESHFDDLVAAFTQQETRGHYLGYFSMEPCVALLDEFGSPLDNSRTTNIIVAAHRGELETAAEDRVIVPRGLRPQVPREWLTGVFVFNGNDV